MNNNHPRRGFYRITDRIVTAYYEGNDQELAEAIEHMADVTKFGPRQMRAARARRYRRRLRAQLREKCEPITAVSEA